jgi:AraC family transcriptional regulator
MGAFESNMKETTLELYKERMLKVLVHIQQHLDDELSLEDLASLAFFSPYHFHRVFRGMLGESLKGHIRRLRLERAASRLKQGRKPVTQIAFEAGYETHEAFTRAFKSMTGCSPSRFRSEKRPLAFAAGGVHYREGKALIDFQPAKPGEVMMNVKLKTMDPMRVAFVRHVGPYDECKTAWDRLCAYLGKEGLLGPTAVFLGVCHDDPEVTPPEKIRYDACVTVDDDFSPRGEIGVQTLEGGVYACVTHFGPYDKLGDTYAEIMGEWLPRSGRELRSSPCFELYMNDPEGTAPEDLVTDIHVPLK